MADRKYLVKMTLDEYFRSERRSLFLQAGNLKETHILYMIYKSFIQEKLRLYKNNCVYSIQDVSLECSNNIKDSKCSVLKCLG